MIVFAWRGFPQYAARCVGAFVKTATEEVVVVAPKPMVPVEGMEVVCGCRVYWVDRKKDFSSQVTSFDVREISAIVVSGWGIPALDDLRLQVKKAGGWVVMMSDHCQERTLREFLSNIRFRLFKRRLFDCFFVPGKSGRRLMRSFGVPGEKIAEGLYAADDTLFHDGLPLWQREKKIIFVGQLNDRKNVLRLVRAFKSVNVNRDWVLDIYGCGPLKDKLLDLSDECTHVNDFLQPEILAEKYREARIFCLPSIQENWGLVVHEGVLSGCVLLIGNTVGSKDDLLGLNNGFSFDAQNENELVDCLRKVMAFSREEWEQAHQASLLMSRNASIKRFCLGLNYLLGLRK